MSLYSFARVVVGAAYRLFYRIRVEGLENIPEGEGLLLCSNHFHANDPIVLGIAAPRQVHFMAKEELFRIPILNTVIRWLGAFPVRRGRPDRTPLKRAIEVLHSGRCVGIFPEGTRVRSGKLGKAEPGTAYLALKAGARVVPVGITSTYRLFSPVIVKFGRPIDLSRYVSGKITSEALDQASQAIMAAIGELLEPPVHVDVAAGAQE